MSFPLTFWSLAPAVVALGLAIATRRVVLSLMVGVAVGSLIYATGGRLPAPGEAPAWGVRAAIDLCETRLWASLSDGQHLRVFVFTALMGAMTAVMQRSGGMAGLVQALVPLARGRRGGQVLGWGLGLAIFFDDYANALLLGGALRPLYDRLRISREKLAYIVDSTSAPVAGLALISTWIAGEIGFIDEGLAGLGFAGQADAFAILVATLPYRFYVWWTLAGVLLIALLGREFGPMLRAERRALREGPPPEPAEPAPSEARKEGAPPAAAAPRAAPCWWYAAAPVAVLIAATILLLLATGRGAAPAERAHAPGWLQVFSAGDSYVALVYASAAGLATAMLLPRLQGQLSWFELGRAADAGVRLVAPALLILWLAWALSDVSGEKGLRAGEYLSRLLHARLPVQLLPVAVFCLAAATSFATGTSWGTMALIMPLAIPTAHRMLAAGGAPVEPYEPLFLATVGSVLAGSIFGDHCSPVSDTTILSAAASGCSLMDHTWTQLPYASAAAALTMLALLLIGWGWSVWLVLPLGPLALAVLLFAIGRKP